MNERTSLPGERPRPPGGSGNGTRWAAERGKPPAPAGSVLPKDPRFDEGEKHFQLGHYDRAVEIWETALAAAPANDHLLNRLGDAWARLGKVDSAAAFWERAARVAADQGFFLRAVPILRKVLKLHPKRLDVQERIADFYSRGKREMEAQEELRTLGEAYIQEGQLRRATAVFEKLAQGDRGDINSHITLAHLYVEGGRGADAARCFVLLGRWLATHGHLSEAPGYFRRAAELMPTEPAIPRALSEIHRELGDIPAAIAALEKAVEMDPSDVALLSRLRELCVAEGRDEEAARLLARLAEVAPENVEVGQHRADALLEEGDVDAAYQVLRPMADAAAARGEGIRAVALLAPILRADPAHVPALQACLDYYRRAWAARLAAEGAAHRVPEAIVEIEEPARQPGGILDREERDDVFELVIEDGTGDGRGEGGIPF